MITIQFVLIHDDSETILESKVFENAKSKFDKDVDTYIYNRVLDLDMKYDFIEYETCPYIEIRYLNNVGELLYRDNCIDYMYNL